MKFHERLKELRKNNKMTQEELSLKMGISAAAIGLYEQARRNPDNDTLIKLASIFNVSIDYLLGFEEANSTSVVEFDDYTYALCNEVKGLSDVQKDALLQMAKAMKANG